MSEVPVRVPDEWFVGFHQGLAARFWRAAAAAMADDDAQVVRRLLPDPPASVLDVPCGDGRLTTRLAAAGYAVTGVDLIASEVDRLTGLLDRLLSPAPARPFEALNIHAVLERVLRLAESDAGWAVRLARDYDPSLPEFPGDADRLTQALWNLVRNAIEAGAANVTLRTRAEHGLRIGDELHPLVLRLEIADDGRGVPEELSERIFLPLVSGRAEGSGLGLALAQQVAREHRGSLAYRSRPGHTVFTLLLPMEPAPETGP